MSRGMVGKAGSLSDTSPLFFGHCPKGGAMKASKRNEERMTLSEKGWMMNGMAYEKCKACVTCGEHYYRRVSSDEPCCSTACLTNYRAKQKIAKAKSNHEGERKD